MRRRVPSTLSLGLLVVAWLAGCALKPEENPPAASQEECPGSNPLHMVSTSPPKHDVDPKLESLLAQRPVDPRLTRINRQMYQFLHALDAEIRREQRIIACKPTLNDSTLAAQSSAGANHPPNVDGSAVNPNSAQGAASAASAGSAPDLESAPRASSGLSRASAPSAISTSSAVSTTSTTSQTSRAAAGAAGRHAQASPVRKANVSETSAGGNGAAAPKIVPGSDDDIVARRLRKAAEAETDPTLRAKLWKEYMDYRQGTGVAK